MNVATAPCPPPFDTHRMRGSTSSALGVTNMGFICICAREPGSAGLKPSPTIIRACGLGRRYRPLPEVVQDARALAERKRVLDGAGDVALRALDRRRHVVSKRKPCRDGRRESAPRAVYVIESSPRCGQLSERSSME